LKFVFTFFLITLISVNSFSQDWSITNSREKPPLLIPQPSTVNWVDTTLTLIIGPGAEISSNEFKFFENEINYLCEYLRLNKRKQEQRTGIKLIKDSKINGEAYSLSVTGSGIDIKSGTKRGAFYAIQTLLQLMPSKVYSKTLPITVKVPFAEITDKPHFPWRGLLLDCSRHFMEKEFVLRYIDLLAYHKMNTLHWHITEDQGWRIEIKKYPKLTEVSAWRKDVNDEAEGDLYGGFYTQEEVKEIVAYAKSRHINVVPEIEMPGHSQAALAAYPEYSCTGGPFEVETEWGVFKEIYCAGNPNTTQFLKDVLDEVLELFPSKYIHIGADEVPKYRWEHCSKCQATIKKHKLKDEEELQSHFLSEINNYLKSKGRIMVGWDEIAEGGLPEDVIVQSWRGYEGAEHAIAEGHQTIVSPTSHAYFDYDLKSIDLEKVYNFNPYPENIIDRNKHLVLGGECNMWSERAPQHLVDSKVFPRLLAMSEVLWTFPENRHYENFYKKVQAHYNRLDVLEVKYGFETVPVSYSSEIINDETVVTLLPGTPDLLLTVEKNKRDKIETFNYTQPFVIDESCELSITANKKGTKNKNHIYGEPVIINYTQHKAIGKSYQLEKEYSKHYTGGNYNALSNGWLGTTDFRDGNWQGYFGDDMVAVFDFSDKPIKLKEVSCNFLQYNNSWIFMPSNLKVEVSKDGINYTELKSATPKIQPKERGRHIENIAVAFPKQTVKHLKVTAQNFGFCPDWHEAAGSKAWLFVDEIMLK